LKRQPALLALVQFPTVAPAGIIRVPPTNLIVLAQSLQQPS
jgi:hypothetical protein